MLRRFSTNFKRSKSDRDTKQNGTPVNGDKRQSKVSPVRKPSADEERSNKAEDGVSVFDKYAQVLHASRSPLPNQTGDGATFEEHQGSRMQDLRALGFQDLATAKNLIMSKAKGEPVDDKTMLMEKIIQLVSGLPGNSKTRADLTNAFLNELWDSLPHPPLSYMGPEYSYRSADGSNNNPTLPWLGAANTPYARSIAPLTIQPGGLPDAGLVFDSLFARQKFNPHPNKVSSLFFDWASLIIHDIFQTDPRNPHINKTSGYLDLSILYGDVQEEQDLVRTHKDGKLKPDAFSEPRLQAFPPACCVMLVMLNRFHNYVVEQLAEVNENGRFTKPGSHLSEEQAKKAWAKYDEDLFQTGRLVTCGLYINITLYDYLRTIVNLNRVNSTWCLDPRAQMEGNDPTPSGLGNQCSVEFNLAYRWHSTISENDEKWTEKIYEELMGKPAAEVTIPDLIRGLGKYEQGLSKDPSERTFAGLQRQEDGTFRDEELVNILANAIEDVASSFGARNVPKALRAVEILGINQARRWNVGSLNEFRKFFGLKPYERFEDINSNEEVAEALRHLYEHPDYVELYPGIVAEEAKEPMIPGVGIAPTYTISRAVLSDAVALVRGDRFYTVDYNPRNLTNWGYNEVRYDLNVNQGCVFYKLATRAFPNWFKHDSIYAHYPMTIPSENRNIMKNLGRESHYSYDRPAFTPPHVNLVSYPNVKLALEREKDFRVVWSGATSLTSARGGDDFWSKSLNNDQWRKNIKDFYEDITAKLLQDKSGNLAGIKQIDITRDIGNLAPVHFASKLFSLPLKTKENSRGVFTDSETFMIMAVIFTSIFFDIDKTKSFSLHHAARAVSQQLGQSVESHIKSINSPGFLGGIIDSFRNDHNVLKEYGDQLIKKLLESGLGVSDVTYSQVLPAAVAMVHNQAQMFTQIIDYYLSEGTKHLPEINRLAKEDSKDSEDKLMRYCLEAFRLNGTFGSYREAQTDLSMTDETGEVDIKRGDKVFVGAVKANRDPNVFQDPNEVRLDRPLESYIQYGLGPHTGLGKETTLLALTSMLRVVGGLDNLRRAPGPQGQLKKIHREGGYYVYLREDWGSYSPFPTTFKVHFDGAIPAPKKRFTSS
ncbi:peroxidase/cytochrome P450 family protein [Aspergillus alliaceus]|uniref:peroxidase/cytochrome P450 family protein n=1 Tax=Petromyces alliaceus TaxID=209559 RepID=UPI0012A46D9C|nr:heme peroxidase [Aspergillus alliaceus]KAB8232735.1 heme peroxidase [Aspergillus alliaceus]